MELVNPYTGTVVEADGDVADRLVKVGFTPVPVAAPARKPGRPKKN